MSSDIEKTENLPVPSISTKCGIVWGWGCDCGVGGVSEGSGDLMLVPADALVLDRVVEAAFVVVEAG